MGNIIVTLILISAFGVIGYMVYILIKNSKSLAEIIAYITLTIVIFTILFIYYLDRYNIPTKLNLIANINSQNWLSFLGNYFGAVIGAVIGALVAVWTTLYQIKKNNEQNEIRDKENLRVQNMPIIKYEVNSERRGTGELNELLLTNVENSDGYAYEFNIIIKNISENSIKDIIVDFKSDIINNRTYRLTGKGCINPLEGGGIIEINRYFSLKSNNDYEIFLTVYYQDVLSNWYKQDLVVFYNATNRFKNGQYIGSVNFQVRKEERIEEKGIKEAAV